MWGYCTWIVAQLRNTIGIGTLHVAGARLQFSDNIRSLWVEMDSALSFDAQMCAICKSCNYRIERTDKFATVPSGTSPRRPCLCRCGIPFGLLKLASLWHLWEEFPELQRAQNGIGQVAMWKHHDWLPLLFLLHSLPVAYRIQYKSMLQTEICYQVIQLTRP